MTEAIPATLDNLKQSLRINHTLDDAMLTGYLAAARQFVLSAVDQDKTEADFADDQRFQFAVSLLVQHWYTNRGVDGAIYAPESVMSMIQQLRGADNAISD